MSKLSESSQPVKRQKASVRPITAELARELAFLEKVKDADIDMTGMPESLDWAASTVGKYYRPIKEPVSMRIDADVLNWARSLGRGYQSQVNELMRIWMYACQCTKGKKTKQTERQAMQLAVRAFVERGTKKRTSSAKKSSATRKKATR